VKISGSDVSSGVNSCSRLSHRCALKKAGVDDAERGEKIRDRDIRQICRKFLNRKKVRASGEKIEPK
jgi:hypothetical protein